MTSSVLFVCSLNICRSVAAHGVFRYILRETGLEAEVDSAGVSAVAGRSPEALVCRAGAMRGYDLSGIRSKPLAAMAVDDFDYLVAMDSSQLAPLRERCTNTAAVHLLMEYSGYFDETGIAVPPAHEGVAGCLQMFDRIEDACLGLWRHLDGQCGGRAP